MHNNPWSLDPNSHHHCTCRCPSTWRWWQSADTMMTEGVLSSFCGHQWLCIIFADQLTWHKLCQAIIWTNAGILLIGPLGTNFSEILIKIHTFSFNKMHLKMSSGKWRAFCLRFNVLSYLWFWIHFQWSDIFEMANEILWNLVVLWRLNHWPLGDVVR